MLTRVFLFCFQADVILIMTCSIRDGAEQKIWKKLHYLKGLKKKREKFKSLPPLKIGVLGMLYFNLIFLEPQ